MLSGGQCGSGAVGAQRLPGHLLHIPTLCSQPRQGWCGSGLGSAGHQRRAGAGMVGDVWTPLDTLPVFSPVGAPSASCATHPCTAGPAPMLWETSEPLRVLLTAWWVPGCRLSLGVPGQEPGSSSAGPTALPPSQCRAGGLGASSRADGLLCSGRSFMSCFSLHLPLRLQGSTALPFASAHHAMPSPRQRPTGVSCSLSSRWH